MMKSIFCFEKPDLKIDSEISDKLDEIAGDCFIEYISDDLDSRKDKPVDL